MMRTILHSLLARVAVLLVAGCLVACGMQPPQLVSPLQTVLESPLIDSRWRVEAVTYQGAALPLDVIAPIYVTFTRLGTVAIYPDPELPEGERCPRVWYPITYQGEGYQLAQGRQTFERCPDTHAPLHTRVLAAFRLTEEYALDEDALTLRGPEAEVRLVLDNP